MMRHETERLWALAADELDLEDKRYVELHLSDCPECTDSLEAVRLARRALSTARLSAPSLDWAQTDARVGALVEKRMRALARPRWMPWAAAGSLVAVAAALTVLLWPASPQGDSALPSEPPLVEVEAPKTIRVEVARGLTRVSAESEPVVAGARLESGDVLRTGVAGRAFMHLPDSSHLRVSAATQFALTRAEPDDVALTLSRGRIAVRASHAARRRFVVHAGDVAVYVVGTVFSVSNGPEGVEVAVSEGAVRVASGEAGQASVVAGQRLLIDPRGKAKLRALTPALERELNEVQGLAEAVSSAEQQVAVVAAKGGGAGPRAAPGALPRLTPEASKARVVEPEAMVAPTPAPTAEGQPQADDEPWDGPGTAFPSLAGGFTRGVPPRVESPRPVELAPGPGPSEEAPGSVSGPGSLSVPGSSSGPSSAPLKSGDIAASEESEWATLPSPARAAPLPPMLVVPSLEPEAAHAPARPVTPRGPSKSLEELFLEKAEASLEKGGCERFLPGLEDLVLESRDAAQRARVLRARCFEAELRPRQAMSEYAKYLEAWPKGRYADEARAALGQ